MHPKRILDVPCSNLINIDCHLIFYPPTNDDRYSYFDKLPILQGVDKMLCRIYN